MEGLREWLAEQNGNGISRHYADLTDTPPRFVRARRALQAMAKPVSFRSAVELFEAHGFNPTEALMIAAKRGAFEEKTHAKVLMHLSEMQFPKLSRAEVEAHVKDDVERNPTDRAARVVAALAAGGVDAARLAAVLGTLGAAPGAADAGKKQPGGRAVLRRGRGGRKD